MPRLQIPRKLLPFQQKKKRYKIAIGGRGSAKSTTIADINLMDAQTQGLKIGCFREFQNSIEDSVKSLLESEIERLGIAGYQVQKTSLVNNNGGEFKFRGLARNTESVKSMSGFDRFWIEEGQFLSANSIKLLTPTLREEGSEIWISANPMSSADPFSQRFIVPFQRELERDGYYEDDLHLIIVVNHHDNPFFPDVLEQERKYDQEHLSLNDYEHIWLGKYNDSIENSIIPVKWFNAAIDAHKKLGFKPVGAKVVAHDPSDEGDDAKGLAYRHGSVFLDVRENDTGDVNEGMDWASDYAEEVRADLFTWDCDGLGVSLKRQVEQAFSGKRIDYRMFKGSESVDHPDEVYQENKEITKDARTNRQTFKNKRAQYYWKLRDRFHNTYRAVEKGEYIDPDEMISLSSDIENIEQLRSEVCRIPRKKVPSGLIQIMSKDDMWSIHKIPSPNRADSMMMAMISADLAETVDLTFESEF